jgi:putative serine protease PepD
MTLPTTRTLAAAAALLAAGGGGAAIAEALSSHGGTRTVVQQVTVAGSQPAASTSALTVGSIYRQSSKGVVEITVTTSSPSPFGTSQPQQAQGSGFVYDAKGDIVTNEHVVAGAQAISVKFASGLTAKATLVGSDASTDLAVIRVAVPAAQLQPLQLGDSSKLSVGDGVVAIGSPFGLEGTVTSGIVSALHRQITSPSNFAIDDSIQTDAAINHGNSGGPLLDMQGQVIGVTAQIQSDSGGNDGVGFAIPSNTVSSVASQLVKSGKAQHAYLGVALASSGTGTRVASVKSGTPAAKAGLVAGDVITALGGTSVSSGDALRAALAARQPGDKVPLTYTRGGKSHTVQLTLGARPS